MMSKERFENGTSWKMSYEEYRKCYCPDCSRENCIHREAYRRVPKIDGGLGLCPNLQNEKKGISMNPEIKNLNGWREFSDRTGKKSIYDYLNKGDIVAEDIVDNFMDMLPPRAMSKGYLQFGEPYSHVYDIDGRLRPTFMTFAKYNGQWRYYGNCFAYETIDRTYC